MNAPAIFEVRIALLVSELIGGSQKLGAVPGYALTLYPLPPILYPIYHTDYSCALVLLQFSIGIAGAWRRLAHTSTFLVFNVIQLTINLNFKYKHYIFFTNINTR